MPKILIIGEGGQLAQSLRRLRWPAGHELAFHGRRTLGDGIEADRIRDLVRAEGAHLVLNAAAYTGVDRAESEPQAAWALNAALPRALAEACAALAVPLVHVSTDYVFDGERGTPYVETDRPNPISVYGATKLEGDRSIERSGLRRWAILRASWLFSEIGDTFPRKMLRRLKAGEELRVVDDQVGCPTSARGLSQAMQVIGLRLMDEDQLSQGLFNYCGSDAMSWFGFAERVVAAAAKRGLPAPPLHGIASAQLDAAARRPRNSVLSCEKIVAQCGIPLESSDAEIERTVHLIIDESVP